jgi:Fe-S cluster biogenesis protein NfuA
MMAEHNHKIADDQEKMRALIENISAYIEQYHGGWVKLVSFDGTVLKVKLGGACDGCPLTETTLQGWVAGTVRQFFPDVKTIEAT